MAAGIQLGAGMKYTRIGQETVHQIRIEFDLPIPEDGLKEGADLQVMIDLLQIEVTDVAQCRGRSGIIRRFDFFIEVDGHFHRYLLVLPLLIVFGDLFFGVSQRIICDRQELRMFPDASYVSGRSLLAVAKALLDEVGRIF